MRDLHTGEIKSLNNPQSNHYEMMNLAFPLLFSVAFFLQKPNSIFQKRKRNPVSLSPRNITEDELMKLGRK